MSNPYKLYLVTDDQQDLATLEHVVELSVVGGVTMVQVREKHGDVRAFIERAQRVKAILSGTGVPLIINDRVDVALAVDADGLHLGQSDMPAEMARQLIGEDKILDNAELHIQKGERVCLVGRNGAGKSSLMKLLLGINLPDSGVVRIADGCTLAELPQSLPAADDRNVMDVVLSGKAELGKVLHDYHELSMTASTDQDMKKLEILQGKIEAQDGWLLQTKADAIIEKLNLPKEKTMAELSGGWRRRVMLGRALLSEPDLLLLDEPTNHLDIPAIEWLEEQLADFPGAVLFVTHDRAFMEKVAKQVIDLDRGNIFRYDGSDFDGLVEWREKRIEDEEKENALFDKRLAEEEKWIRQGIKARRTRNEGRVRALLAMRNEFKERRKINHFFLAITKKIF